MMSEFNCLWSFNVYCFEVTVPKNILHRHKNGNWFAFWFNFFWENLPVHSNFVSSSKTLLSMKWMKKQIKLFTIFMLLLPTKIHLQSESRQKFAFLLKKIGIKCCENALTSCQSLPLYLHKKNCLVYMPLFCLYCGI